MRAATRLLERGLKHSFASLSSSAAAKTSPWRSRALLCASVGGGTIFALVYDKDAAECKAEQIGFLWGRGSAAKGSSTVPERLIMPAGVKDVIQMHFSSRHGVAVDRSGNVWTWRVDGAPSNACMAIKGHGVAAVACSESRIYALRSSGTVFSWDPSMEKPIIRKAFACGDGRKGQLGTGKFHEEDHDKFEQMVLPKGETVKSVAVGGEHTLVLSRQGSVYACGADDKLQLGQGRESIKEWSKNDDDTVKICSADLKLVRMPKELAGGKVVFIAAGGEFCMAIVQPASRSAPTSVVAWGHGVVGQLGHKDFKHVGEPRVISAFSAKKEWDEKTKKVISIGVKEVACGSEHTVALLTNGAVMTFGGNKEGEIGCGSRKATKEPSLVMPLQMYKVSRVFAGSRTSAVLV